MLAPDDMPRPCARFAATPPATPLVVSIPHAGRDYAPALLTASLLPVETLAALEDRHADRLADGLAALGVTVFIARRPRAWIDLNRDERELDPVMLATPPRPGRLLVSPKVRGGLGLVPRRIAGAGEIWRRKLTDAEVEARLADDHRPWHDAIASALSAARARFGVALLLDLHSMPPLSPRPGEITPRLVIGDRHGRSAGQGFVDRLHAIAATAGHPVARNQPYAGGHTLDRHGRPSAGIHAIQLEVDRSLYLAPDLRRVGPGLPATTALIGHMAKGLLAALAAEIPTQLAAE